MIALAYRATRLTRQKLWPRQVNAQEIVARN
jgi:hypothetical protein